MQGRAYAEAAGYFERGVALLRRLGGQPVYQEWLRAQQRELTFCRAASLAGRGRHAEAAATAEELRALASHDPSTLYDVARCYALCASGVAPAKAPDRLSPDQSRARKHYTARALAALAEALRRGFKDVRRMETDPDLAAIRTERQYRQLVEGLRQERPRTPRP